MKECEETMDSGHGSLEEATDSEVSLANVTRKMHSATSKLNTALLANLCYQYLDRFNKL
jgi:hypothetical protein